MKVLIGYDGSEPAREAIRDLHRAGLPSDAKVLVICAANVWPHFSKSSLEVAVGAQSSQASPMQRKAHALVVESIAEAQALAAEGVTMVNANFPSWNVSHEAYAGSPYVALSRDSLEADLVVVGSHGKSRLARMVLGSVSHHVLMHAPGSVRISRSGSAAAPTAEKPVRIVLGVDGSRHSAVAVSAVAGRAWPAGSEVKIIAVLDRTFWTAIANPQSSAWAWIAEPEQAGEAWALRAVQRVGQELRSAGLTPTWVVQEGDPKKVLLEEAEKWPADCIFVGAKGLSALERFLLGSVSAAVATRAHCSVEVVR